MSDKRNGIPLYQLMEVHRHICTLKNVFPELDPLNRIVPGGHSIVSLRGMLAGLGDEDVTDLARAVSGLIGCDRVIGLTEIPPPAVDKGEP